MAVPVVVPQEQALPELAPLAREIMVEQEKLGEAAFWAAEAAAHRQLVERPQAQLRHMQEALAGPGVIQTYPGPAHNIPVAAEAAAVITGGQQLALVVAVSAKAAPVLLVML
jgi:hypothetical protein